MAQGAVAPAMAERAHAGSRGADATMRTTSDEIHEMRQYEELLRFRDQVGSGLHPRIKPTHFLGKPSPSSSTNGLAPGKPQTTASKGTVNGTSGRKNTQLYQDNAARSRLNGLTALPGLGKLQAPSAGPSKPVGSGKPEIDPIFLEKSDNLKKAEMRLRRQGLERSLKEELEQSRAASRACLQAAEQLAELDVAGVLEQATSVAQSALAQPTDNTAANAEASSDSFDDNTFYSSQHDTPSSHAVSRLPNESEDEEMRDGSPYEPELDPQPIVPVAPQAQPPVVPASGDHQNAFFQQQGGLCAPGSGPVLPQAANVAVPGISSEATGSNRPYQHLLAPGIVSSRASGSGSGSGSRSEESGTTGMEGTSDSRDLSRVNERLISQGIGHRDSPLVRAHDLSPVAPQPAHVSPLAMARQQPLPQADSDIRRGTPAQVAALRKQHSAATSPDSSPQTSRTGERRKKKKKRKSDRFGHEPSAASPYIKPEPRSPSPMTAPPYARPTKRQRQANHQASEFGYEEARYDRPVAVNEYQERYQPRVHREERVVGYERIDETGHREVEPVLVDSQRYERLYFDEPRPAVGTRQPLPDSPQVFDSPYASREVRSVRPVSRIIEPGLGESAYFPEVRSGSRTGVRPPTYRTRSQSPIAYERHPSTMPPPRTVPTRILVDTYGREYIEPPRATTIIEASPYTGAQVFSVPPPRAVSRRPEANDDNGMLYDTTSPAYSISRRVVTQPDFVTSERVYREGSQALVHPVSEYIPSRSRLDSRATMEPPREYISRAASTRPQYDSSLGYGGSRSAEDRGNVAPRYELSVATYERRVGDEIVRELGPVRSASVRPPESVRYEPARGYGVRIGSVRPDIPAREYTASAHPDGRREAMQPPPAVSRGYSVVPNDPNVQMMRRGPPTAFYGQPVAQGDDDVVLLDRAPREFYRQPR
ncbi:hypothetical protein OQA88_11929 [Cercophora sp. LCS_1]